MFQRNGETVRSMISGQMATFPDTPENMESG
jgi:hypothetical protein